MSRVTHFEIPAKDKAKIVAFYKEVFGWEFIRWEGPVEYWLVSTGPEGTPGINGGLYTPAGAFANGYTGVINTIDVTDLDAALAKVTANGGSVVFPKDAVPGVGWLAYCKDVEGTIFGMMQTDPAAGQSAT